MYKEKLKELLIQGGIGIVIGFVLALCTISNAGILSVLIGILFAGVPYGWQLSGKLLGFISLSSLYVTVCIFMLRIAISLMIGWIIYPIILIYTIVRMVMEKNAVSENTSEY